MQHKKLGMCLGGVLLAFAVSVFAKPKTYSDVIQVVNQPDQHGYASVFTPFASFDFDNSGHAKYSGLPVRGYETTVINFDFNQNFKVKSDITITARDAFTGKLYTCDEKVPHDATGPAGNYWIAITLPIDPNSDKPICKVVKK